MRLRPIIMSLVSIAGCLVAAGVSAPTADAAVCSGTLVAAVPALSGLGEMDLYYNTSTGMNCAVMNHGASNWGAPLWTQIALTICREDVPNTTCTPIAYKENSGTFKYYAGPVSSYGRGHCVRAFGTIAGQVYGVGVGYANGGGAHC